MTTFTFIGRYRDETDFRNQTTGQRYRLKDDGKLTVDGMEPDLASFREFRKWQEATHKADIAEMRANPAKYPPHIVEEVDKPVFAKASGFWQWFDYIAGEAAETDDGKAFIAAGFSLQHTGGGCTAWRRDIPEMKWEVLITNGMSGHLLEDEAGTYWVGSCQSETGDDGPFSEGHATAASAIEMADEIVKFVKLRHGAAA